MRLDARTHIKKNYLKELYFLSKDIECANVGAPMVAIGLSDEQKKIALIMNHKFAFGGASFRDKNFEGFVPSVYLGFYNKKMMPKNNWFDKNSKISEDSDLNYRIYKSGQKVYMSSNIKIYYYAREDKKSLFRLAFNYGVARALYIKKNKSVTSIRQLLLPFLFLVQFFLLISYLLNFIPLFFLISPLLLYFFFLIFISITVKKKKDIAYFINCFLGIHIFWTFGFFRGLIT